MSENNREYLFDWERLVKATINFPPYEASISALFSRVYLEDFDLMKLGEDDHIARKLRKLNLKSSTTNYKFYSKLAYLGFEHGFHLNSSSATEIEVMAKMPYEDSEEDDERVATCYTDLDLFTDIKFESFAPSKNIKRINNNPHKFSKSISVDSICDEIIVPQTSTNQVPETEIDFDYEPVRDAKLVAKNANELLKNDKEIMKYWYQRYRLFSKFNNEVLMDREGWFSVTPERIAEHIADRMVVHKDCVILDAFTGVGGNAIQFALRGAIVYAIDIDPIKIRCARRNAEIYGVSDRITFICGNFLHVANSFLGSRSICASKLSEEKEKNEAQKENYYGIDGVFLSPTLNNIKSFLSPPWGGPSYQKSQTFDLEKHVEPNGREIYELARKISPDICYFLPKNTSAKQLIALAGPGSRVEIEQNLLNGKYKTLSAYYGSLIAE